MGYELATTPAAVSSGGCAGFKAPRLRERCKALSSDEFDEDELYLTYRVAIRERGETAGRNTAGAVAAITKLVCQADCAEAEKAWSKGKKKKKKKKKVCVKPRLVAGAIGNIVPVAEHLSTQAKKKVKQELQELQELYREL